MSSSSRKINKRQILVSKIDNKTNASDKSLHLCIDKRSQNKQSHNYQVPGINQNEQHCSPIMPNTLSENQLQDNQDEQIIKSMKEKQKILNRMKVLKEEMKKKQQPKKQNNLMKSPTNYAKKTQSMAKLNTLSSVGKMNGLSNQISPLNNEKIKSYSQHNSESSKKVKANHPKKVYQAITKKEMGKQINSKQENTKIQKHQPNQIFLPKRLQYSSDILMMRGSYKSKNRNFQPNLETVEYYGFNYLVPDQNGKIGLHLKHSLQNNKLYEIKNNEHRLPYRFQC